MKLIPIVLTLLLNIYFASLVVAEDTAYPPKSGWEAFNELTRGNQRFRQGRELHPRRDTLHRDKLADARAHTAVVTCSDPRVAPELLMDQGFGDLFVVRSLGLALDSAGRASIEYAIDELDVKFLIILASDSCIGLKEAHKRKGDPSQSNSVDQRDLFERVWRQTFDRTGVDPHAAHLESTVKSASYGVMRELIESSEIIEEAILKRKLLVGLSTFNLITGRVNFWTVGYPSIVDSRIKWTQPGTSGFTSPGGTRKSFK